GRGALVVVLLVTAVLAASLAGPWDPPLRGADLPLPAVTQAPAATPEPDPIREALEQVDSEPWDLTWLGVVLAVAALAGLAYLAYRVVRALPPRRGEDAPDDAGVEGAGTVSVRAAEPDLQTLRDAVRGADTHLAARVPPADAVIAAWVALEEAAQRSGVPRDPAATPTEFTLDVLDRTPVDPAAGRVLLALYLRARFSTEPLGADDVAAATTAVRTLAAGLAERGDAP
ncbi:DUF4129 domain-containing protein, partial [Actinotalea sp. JY-7885]